MQTRQKIFRQSWQLNNDSLNHSAKYVFLNPTLHVHVPSYKKKEGIDHNGKKENKIMNGNPLSRKVSIMMYLYI